MSCLGIFPVGNAMTQLYVLLIGHLGLTKGRRLEPGLNLEAVLQRSFTFKAFLTSSIIRLIDSGFGPGIIFTSEKCDAISTDSPFFNKA